MFNRNSQNIDALKQEYSDYIKYIKSSLSKESRLLQGAEESSELGQAMAKYARIIMNENPTPVSKKEATSNLNEEFNDLLVVALVLDLEIDPELIERKLSRWTDRLQSMKKNRQWIC